MKKKVQLNEKKIAGFTAVAGAIIAGNVVDAQIVYTDVSPDVVIDTTMGMYAIDFNNDAVPDVQFTITHVTGTGTYGSYGSTFTYQFDATYAAAIAGTGGGLQQTLVAGSGSSSTMTSALAPLNNGDAINGTAMFTQYGTLALDALITIPAIGYNYPFQGGEFIGVTDKFLGAKFLAGANTHYGWVRLDVAADASTITIKDYAFNATPDGEILAGQTVNLEDIAIENKVTVKTTLNEAFINVTPDLIGGTVNLFNLSGQVVASTIIKEINTRLSFEGIDTGIYTVAAQFDGGQVNKKVYVK
jgi:hypothetical protein